MAPKITTLLTPLFTSYLRRTSNLQQKPTGTILRNPHIVRKRKLPFKIKPTPLRLHPLFLLPLHLLSLLSSLRRHSLVFRQPPTPVEVPVGVDHIRVLIIVELHLLTYSATAQAMLAKDLPLRFGGNERNLLLIQEWNREKAAGIGASG